MKKGLFRTADGNNYMFTFLLVCSLFLLWGLCNGMIDVLNKHFQNSLNVSKTGSALVQFANYMGYFFMAIPAGMLAKRFGYKGGMIIGLVLIAIGAFWFIPATRIGTYWAFLTGLFILATGLTCLETIANPYATVLGSPEMAATRINLAQSTNGIGWILGPIVLGAFTLSSTGEVNRSNDALYKPYLLVGIIVTILIVIFARCKFPDLHNEDATKSEGKSAAVGGKPLFKRWHFVAAVVAQFFYVAAQTGIFSFFINYVVSDDMPVLNQSLASKLPDKLTHPAAEFFSSDVKDISGLAAKLQNDTDPKTKPVSEFIWSQFDTNTVAILSASPASAADPKALHRKQLDTFNNAFNRLLQTNILFEARRVATLAVPADLLKTFASAPQGEQLARANRALIEVAYPETLIARSPYLTVPTFRFTEAGAAALLSVGGFGLFLLGRFVGSAVLGICKAHTTLAIFGTAAAVTMVLVVMGLGWISAIALFLSFFCMSIMFPTIFALGIHGLGEHTKLASSLIVMSIVGGAIMPMLMGAIAEYSMRVGFLMPLGCFVIIVAYAASWLKLQGPAAQIAAEPIKVTARH